MPKTTIMNSPSVIKADGKLEKKMSYRIVSLAFVAIAAITGLVASSLFNSQPIDKTVGQAWPANQRVAFGDIDHSSFNRLLQTYVNRDGMVNYKAWKANAQDHQALIQYLDSLGRADERMNSTPAAKLAYWINAYNAVTIEGILRVYPTTSIRKHTAKLVGYNIWKHLKLYSGDRQISLNDIEHKVLRPMGEPRIHFAIVCASIGCPRLLNEAYTADKIDAQLTVNSKDFFSRSQNLQVDAASRQIKASSILSWFGEDFGNNQTTQIQAVSKYFPPAAKAVVDGGNFRVSYLPYDWNLNSQ